MENNWTSVLLAILFTINKNWLDNTESNDPLMRNFLYQRGNYLQ